MTKSVALDLKEGLQELFAVLRLDSLLVENQFTVKIGNFIKDFIREAIKIQSWLTGEAYIFTATVISYFGSASLFFYLILLQYCFGIYMGLATHQK